MVRVSTGRVIPHKNLALRAPHVDTGRRLSPSRSLQVRVARGGISEGLVSKDTRRLETTLQGCPTVDSSLGANYFSEDSRPIILFDGECSLCNGGVQLMLDWDTEGVFRYASLHSTAGGELLKRCGRGADDTSSIVLLTEDRHWIKSQAILGIASRLSMPLSVLQSLVQPIPRAFRDSVYEWVAANRFIFGESNSCRMMAPEWRDRFLY